MTPGSPYAFHLHPVQWIVLAALAATYLMATAREPWRIPGRRRVGGVLGLVLTGLVLGWPIGDLAAHWSLLALVVQRLVLTLAVPPLILLALPGALIGRATAPGVVDAVVSFVVRPPVAVGVVTVSAVATLTVGAVDLQASSVAFRLAMAAVLLVAGCVLWAPVLGVVPGVAGLSPFGRAGYLVVQSIVPSFLSLVWIFARHPIYPAFDHQGTVAGMSPLLDQQLSGFVAKFLTIATLWTVAFVRLSREHRLGGSTGDATLTWGDVSRELARAERRERRGRRWLPPP
jgi:cytochrome c oxidase assembly factor CtaG